MAGPPIYYAQRRILKKTWQRLLLVVATFTLPLPVGLWVQDLSIQRLSKFRGRTALYGDSTLNGGRQLGGN